MSHLGNGWNNIFSAVAEITEPGSMKLLDKNAYVKPFEEHLKVEYANYIGSETSPPCRHGVRWIVSYCPHGLGATAFQVKYSFSFTTTLNKSTCIILLCCKNDIY